MSTKTMSKTNNEFANEDGNFNRWCDAAQVLPTKRQASKWRRQCGAAYKTMKGILPPKKKEQNAPPV